jgi:tetratricopeptide (TPR) repeat protein
MGKLLILPRVQTNSKTGKCEGKILHFRKRGRRYPKAAQAIVDRCEVWLDQEVNLTLCKELIYIALEMDPECFDANYEYARVLYYLGKNIEAANYWIEASRILPGRWEPYYNAGLAKMYCFEDSEAEALLLRASMLNRNEPDILYGLARLYHRSSRRNLELKALRSFVEVCEDECKQEALSRISNLERELS